MCAMPTATWTEARTRKPVAYRIGRGEPPPGFQAGTAARTYSIDAPYITRAPTLCSSSPYSVVNSSPAETAWPYLSPARVVELVRSLAVAVRADAVRRVKDAWVAKDIAVLVGLLDPDAVMTADGGGLVGTALRPIEGGARIAQYMAAIADKAPGLELLERSVNGAPGLVARHAGTVASFDLADDGRVTRIWVVRNPEKLRPWLRDG